MKTITFICGEICSGKSTIAKQTALKESLYFIEVSDIVKALLKTASRDELQKSGFLESRIVIEIALLLDKVKNEPIFKGAMISGVRQRGIINSLESLRDDFEFHYQWIDVPEEERFKRYMERADLAKDKLTREAFEEAQKRDNDLGLQDVKKYFQTY